MPASDAPQNSGWLRALSIVDAAVAALAVWGGISLILGAPGFRWPVQWLAPLGLNSWVIPGVALIVVVGGPMFWGALASWRRTRHAPSVSLTAAVVMLGWLLVQWLVIESRTIVQVATALADLLVIALACASARRRRTW